MPKLQSSKIAGSTLLYHSENTKQCDLFNLQRGESSIEREHTQVITPSFQNNALHFNIPPLPDYYPVLHATTLQMEVAFQEGDGTPLESVNEDDVFCANLPGSSMFESVHISINGTNVPALSTDHYGYKSYISHLLSYPSTTISSSLFNRHYTKDTAGKFHSLEKKGTSTTEYENETLSGRRLRQPIGSSFLIITPILADFFHGNSEQPFFPSTYSLGITFSYHRGGFYLMCKDAGTKQYKLTIKKAQLNMKYVRFIPSFDSKIKEKFNRGTPIIYPFTKTNNRVFNYGGALTQIYEPQIFQGDLPTQIVMVMLETKSYTGDYKKNPYNFEHKNLTKLDVIVNDTSLPISNFQTNFSKSEYYELYNFFLENTSRGACHQTSGPSTIDYNQYGKGYTIFVINLVPSSCYDQKHFHTFKRNLKGSVSLSMQFSKELTTETTLLIFGIYPAAILLTNNKFEVQVPYPKNDGGFNAV